MVGRWKTRRTSERTVDVESDVNGFESSTQSQRVQEAKKEEAKYGERMGKFKRNRC